MFRTILGKPGTGKTELIRKWVVSAAQQGKRVYFIVPEQFSFESERALSRWLRRTAARTGGSAELYQSVQPDFPRNTAALPATT